MPTARPRGHDDGDPADHHRAEDHWADREQSDAAVLRCAAALLRDDPGRGRRIGLPVDEDAVAAAALLEVLARQVAHLDPAVRRRAVESCRAVLDEAGDPGRA